MWCIIANMSKLEVVDDSHGDSLSDDVASRLRGRLAERRIRQTEVMLATGWSKTTAYRKMNGKSPLDVDELEKLWQAFGISPVYLLTGTPDGPAGPSGDGAPSRARTYDLRISRPSSAHFGTVTPLRDMAA